MSAAALDTTTPASGSSPLPRNNSMSRTATFSSSHSGTISPPEADAERTAVDLTAAVAKVEKTEDGPHQAPEYRQEKEGIVTASGAEIQLSQSRKWFLLFIFSIAQYLDIASYSGLFVFTDAILSDLGILYESSSWIIVSLSPTEAFQS